jgi:hypothetical protein
MSDRTLEGEAPPHLRGGDFAAFALSPEAAATGTRSRELTAVTRSYTAGHRASSDLGHATLTQER